MRTGFYPSNAYTWGYSLITTLTLTQPPLQSWGAFVAANATEFSWNASLFFLCGLYLSISPRAIGLAQKLRVAGILLIFWWSAGFSEYAVDVVPNSAGGLWGSPLHLLLAGVLPLSFFFFNASTGNAGLSLMPALLLGALGLGGLGLLWNFSQTSLSEGWAWDWIESGPCWIVGNFAAGAHLWSAHLLPISTVYLAFLALSRTALITSAHHLQSPQSVLSLDLLAGESGLPALNVSTGADTWTHGWLGILSLCLVPSLLGLSRLSANAGVPVYPNRSLQLTLYLVCVAFLLWTVTLALTLTFAGYVTARAVASIRHLHYGFLGFFLSGASLVWFVFDQTPAHLAPSPSTDAHRSRLSSTETSLECSKLLVCLYGMGWFLTSGPSGHPQAERNPYQRLFSHELCP